jgi:AraC-like DNA-binding protein
VSAPLPLLAHFRTMTRPSHWRGATVVHPDTLELCLAGRGREWMRAARKVVVTRAGDFGIIPAGVEHSSWTEASSATSAVVHFDREALDELGRELGWRRPMWSVSDLRVAPLSLRRLVALLEEEQAHGASAPGNALARESLAQAIAVSLVRAHVQPRIAPPAGPSAALRRVEERLRTAPEERHSLSELSELTVLSPFQLVRAFKRRTGKTPIAFLLGLRLERAAELIRATDLSLTQIAHDVGFGSSSRLSEAFKRTFGVSPSVWRLGRDR